ncbi:GNAT family N-acetyltransferase [Flavimaricola marinus]|uniref:Acetyltransferase (GNAT) family protein n=1 Tax=Flavimaricola marinus TaxID=1819565 RepID=A0A238LII0_9RHOB|nr:GNAT family N-acetyltransferase [Flavimaricola marinus]SMY08766.1 Acetyltransferase (GNAT) family protein [Flavimaricola marinus]
MIPTIRPARPSDIPALLGLMRKFCAYHDQPCETGLERLQLTLFDSGRVTALIAETDRPIGYAALEWVWRPMDEHDGLDIAQLYVVDHWRSKGVGRALIGAAATVARQASASQLTIASSAQNPGAAAAYRAMGLTERPAPGAGFRVAL